jgi:hypothetical protein
MWFGWEETSPATLAGHGVDQVSFVEDDGPVAFLVLGGKQVDGFVVCTELGFTGAAHPLHTAANLIPVMPRSPEPSARTQRRLLVLCDVRGGSCRT